MIKNFGETKTGCGSVQYLSAHRKVWSIRGKASDRKCAHCGGAAAQWAYDHQDPDELEGMWQGCLARYSADPYHYVPLCAKCHVKYDNDHRGHSGNGNDLKETCPKGHPYDDQNTRVGYRGSRHCKTCHRDRIRARYQALRAAGYTSAQIKRGISEDGQNLA